MTTQVNVSVPEGEQLPVLVTVRNPLTGKVLNSHIVKQGTAAAFWIHGSQSLELSEWKLSDAPSDSK